MTGQARVLINDHGADIRVQCQPCGIDSADTWPNATHTAKAHNREHHPGPDQIRDA